MVSLRLLFYGFQNYKTICDNHITITKHENHNQNISKCPHPHLREMYL